MGLKPDHRGVVYNAGARGPNKYVATDEAFAAMEKMVEDWCQENGFARDSEFANIRMAFDKDQPERKDLGIFIQLGGTHYGHRAYGIWEILDPESLPESDDRKHTRYYSQRHQLRPGQSRLFFGNGDEMIEFWKKREAGWFGQ